MIEQHKGIPENALTNLAESNRQRVRELTDAMRTIIPYDQEWKKIDMFNYMIGWLSWKITEDDVNQFWHELRHYCDHQFEEYSAPADHRSGWHETKCKKCGTMSGYDTSD
jgi:hypothetical protein